MAKEVRLPKLGQTMEEGTIVGCNIKAGDFVKKGDCIFEIETDKATLEMESASEGFVKRILVQIGQTLPVGEPILILGEKDEVVPQSFIDSLTGAAPAAAETQSQEAQEAPAIQQPEAQQDMEKVIASPRAKKLAKELGIDLASVAGTGPGGRITEDDVKNAGAKPSQTAAQPGAEIKLGATIPLNRLQKITAERMLQSKREIPCFYLTVKADVTKLVEFRTKINAEGRKTAYNDFIIKAVAAGLEKFPVMTGQLAGETIQLAANIDIGLAMSMTDGLIVPVVRGANKKTVAQISGDTQSLVEKARTGKLLLTDLEGGCITVSNLGAFGVESFIPIVVPGQCSILGIGKIADVCVPDDGSFSVCKFMTMTLSVDHKVANGAYAAQFIDFVRKYLEDTSNFA